MITVGLDVGYDAVRMVAIDHTGSRPALHRIAAQSYDIPYSPEHLFDQPDYLTSVIRTVIETYGDPGWPVTIGIRNRFATFLMPQVEKRMKGNQREEWLRWEAGHFVDDSLDHYILDSDLTGYQTDQTEDIFLVAVRRDAVEKLQSLAEAAGIAPAAMTVASIALINAFEKSYAPSDRETVALVHHRMPVIVEPDAYSSWLAGDADNASIFRAPLCAQLTFHRVGPAVNRVGFDAPECIAFYEKPQLSLGF